jgi:hypothetical protein
MLGTPVPPDPFPAMRLPGHSPGPRWWPRYFHPIRRLLFADDVPTGPYAHATVEHDEPAARIQEQHVLLEDKIVSRQEVVGERLGQLLLSRAFQRSGWLSQWQRPVGDHGCLKLADHKAIEIRDLAADDWGTGLAGWNVKASGRSESDGRGAKKHSASGDRRVGHMYLSGGSNITPIKIVRFRTVCIRS